jgi:hypothetical protein
MQRVLVPFRLILIFEPVVTVAAVILFLVLMGPAVQRVSRWRGGWVGL